MKSTIPNDYLLTAADDYENSMDPEDNFCRNNAIRLFLIKEYANWLWTITEKFNIFENDIQDLE